METNITPIINQLSGIASVLGIALIILIAWFWRWTIHTKKTRVLHQSQIDLLAQIAASNGVSKEKISEIVAESRVLAK